MKEAVSYEYSIDHMAPLDLIKVSLTTLINIDSEITSDYLDTYGKLILPFIFGKTSGITMARIHRKTTGEQWHRKLRKSQ